MKQRRPANTPSPLADSLRPSVATTVQHDEQGIQIERHPMGIVGQYIVVGSLLIVAIILALAVVPSLTAYANQGVSALVTIVLGIFILGALGFLCIANFLYWKNEWIVADDGLVQILPLGLVRQRVSQLSFEDLKEITVTQTGLFQKKFHYGTLRIVPNPSSMPRRFWPPAMRVCRVSKKRVMLYEQKGVDTSVGELVRDSSGCIPPKYLGNKALS